MRRGRFARTVLRLLAGPAALVLLVESAAAAPADTREQISEARRRLSALETRISAEQARAVATSESLRVRAGEVGRSRRLVEAIQASLERTRSRRALVAARYRAVRAEIGRAAAEAYVRGPAFVLDAVIDMTSLTDVADALSYTRAITAGNAELAERVARLANDLKQQEREESVLRIRRTAALERLTAQRDALTARLVELHAGLAALARDRAEMASLLVRLRERLRAEELAAAQAALNGGTPISFGEWAGEFLRSLGAPVARNNLVVVVAWEVAEFTLARWNPLATTYPMPGSTTLNGSGVRNYTSLAQGLRATRLTLAHAGYGYEVILRDLARNADPMNTGESINASRWCRGCAGGGYVVDLIPSVEQYYDRYASDRASS